MLESIVQVLPLLSIHLLFDENVMLGLIGLSDRTIEGFQNILMNRITTFDCLRRKHSICLTHDLPEVLCLSNGVIIIIFIILLEVNYISI